MLNFETRLEGRDWEAACKFSVVLPRYLQPMEALTSFHS